MKHITHLSPQQTLTPCAATIGFFDGVHRGHRFLIQQVIQAASSHHLASAIVTFPLHPRQVMQSAYTPSLLTTYPEKLSLLAHTAIDECITIPFTVEVASLTAYDFMRYLREQFAVKLLVIGYDHRFGHDRLEGFEDYVCYGKQLGIEVLQAIPLPQEQETQTVSSSSIRQLLQKGEVESAAKLLGYHYFLEGTVEYGQQVGRTIGFPTANLRVNHAHKLIPSEGVYAVRVQTTEGECHDGMLCISRRPTLDDGKGLSIETSLFNFQGNLYGQSLHIEFIKYVRQVICFDSLNALQRQLLLDKQTIRSILQTYEKP